MKRTLILFIALIVSYCVWGSLALPVDFATELEDKAPPVPPNDYETELEDTAPSVPPNDYETELESTAPTAPPIDFETELENGAPPAPLTDEDSFVKNGDTVIRLGMDFKDLKTNESVTHTSFLDERHVYNTTVYENFKISYVEEIFSITLIASAYETSRGVRVGDDIADVLQKYGIGIHRVYERVYDGEVESYSYPYNWRHLVFYVNENRIITRIKLEYI